MSDLYDEMSVPTSKPKRKRSKTPKKDLEAAVLRECMKVLHDDPRVLYCERRNTGAVVLEGGGFIKFGAKGAADIWCIVEVDPMCAPLHMEIECKRRNGKGRLSADQKKFQAMCISIGLIYEVVTSGVQLKLLIDELCS